MTTPITWPYVPRAPSGDWGVTLPGNASIGELLLWAKSVAPVVFTDWTLYVPCDTDYVKDPASTDPWTAPTFTAGTPATHPDGGPVVSPSTLTTLNTDGPALSVPSTWSFWMWTGSGTRQGVDLYGHASLPVSMALGVDANANTLDGSTLVVTDGDYVISDFAFYYNLTGTWPAGAWHQTVAVLTSITPTPVWDVYLDGVHITNHVGFDSYPTGTLFRFACGPSQLVARIKRWDRALTDDEVAALYAANG